MFLVKNIYIYTHTHTHTHTHTPLFIFKLYPKAIYTTENTRNKFYMKYY